MTWAAAMRELSMHELKRSTMLVLALLMAPLLAQAQSHDEPRPPLSAECRAMQGTYAVVPLADTPEFLGIAAEIMAADIAVGEPVFTLAVTADGVTRTDVASQERTALEPTDEVPSRALFAGTAITCALTAVADDDGIQIIHADLAAMPAPALQELADYLGSFWEAEVDLQALRKVKDFIVVDVSITGVTSLTFVVPLHRL